MTRKALILLTALVLLPWPGRAEDNPAPQQKGILAGAIRLEEEPEEKKGPFFMPFGTSPQDVDINSMIHVRISREDLLAGLSGNPVLTPAAEEVVALRRSAEQLLQAEDAVRRAIADGEELARLALAGRQKSQEFRDLAEGDQEGLRTMFQHLRGHLDALLASPREDFRQHATEARAAMSDAIEVGRPALAAVIVEEIRWTLAQLEQSRVKVEQDAPPLALILSASHVGPGGESELGLPHYNDLPIGPPKSIDKLSLMLPPDQIALHQEAAALAEELNRLRDQGAGLIELARRILAAQGFDFTGLEDVLDKVKEDTDQLRETDWSLAGTRLESRLREALEDATGEERQVLEQLLPAVSDLRARTSDLRASLGGLVGTVQGLRSQLQATTGQNPTDRVLGLLSVLQAGVDLSRGELFQDLRTDLKRWTDSATALKTQIETVRSSAEELPEELKAEVEEILSGAAEEPLGDLVTHLQDLRTVATGLLERFQSLSDEVEGAPALAVALHRDPPATSFRVSFPQIKDTWVDIRTINPRSDDDLLVLRAWLFRMKPDPNDPTQMIEDEELDSDLQQLRLLRFGWHAKPAVGLVYLRSRNELIQEGEGEEEEAETENTRMFAPQVSWLYRYRTWQQAGDPAKPQPFRHHPRWWHSVGVGLHTVTMDLDNDNQQELGLGVSVSFFKDFLQIGAGWDLSLDDEPYVFVGTRLLELARNLGVSNKPAAPEE